MSAAEPLPEPPPVEQAVDAIAERICAFLGNDELVLTGIHLVACHDIGLGAEATSVRFGGDDEDFAAGLDEGVITITEDDPRFALYWAAAGAVVAKALALAITKQRSFR